MTYGIYEHLSRLLRDAQQDKAQAPRLLAALNAHNKATGEQWQYEPSKGLIVSHVLHQAI